MPRRDVRLASCAQDGDVDGSGLGLKWHILENFVHEGAYIEARDLVASNAIGRVGHSWDFV